MSSGVTVSSDAKTVYEEVKKDKKYRYIIYHIKESKTIEVESTGPRDAKYSDLLDQLQRIKDQCRYCIFDFPARLQVDGPEASQMTVDRLILIKWCPETAHVKEKMLYSASYNALKKALVGVYKYVQACEFDEADENTIHDCLKKGGK